MIFNLKVVQGGFEKLLRKLRKMNLRVPLQRLFHLPGGEFKEIFLADWSENQRAVLNFILLDWFGLHEPFYGPGQCF